MKNNKPRSLLWQLGGLAFIVSLLSLVLHVAVTTTWLAPLGEDFATALAARIKMTHEMIAATADAERDAKAVQWSDDRFLVRRQPPAVEGATKAQAPLAPFIDSLLRQLGSGYQVLPPLREPSLSGEPRVLRVAFAIEGQVWQAEYRAQPPIQALLGTGVGWFALAAAAVGASLLLGLRFIVGPIRDVASRIAAQGAAVQPLAEPRSSNAEVRSLVLSFNRLVERLQSADRTKQQLLAGVSHDLRTPLARLRLRIETQCAPEVAEAAEGELRAVEHIVSQFLAFVQGDRDAGVGQPESVRALAQQVVASYAEQGRHVTLDADATDAQAPDLAVTRLLHNLIDNALTHGAEPVKVGWRAPTPGERELSVWDSGPGLNDEEFLRALQPFVRLSANANIGHCGLGLAIVAQVARQWGARLESRREGAGRFGIVVSWSVADKAPRP